MAKSIELVMNFETGEKKEFFQPQHIKGSVALEGLTLGKRIDKKGDDIEEKDIREVASFVANKLYAGEFTADDMIDGLHASNLFQEVMEQLGSVFGDASGNASKAKKI